MPRKKKVDTPQQSKVTPKSQATADTTKFTTTSLKRIQLSELIDAAHRIANGEWTTKDINEYGSKFRIRNYLSIDEKTNCITTAVTRHLYLEGNVQEFKVKGLYKYLFFDVMLGMYAFIDCSDTALLTDENYDLLYPIFGTWIIGYIKNDYKMLENMIFQTVSLYNIREFIDIVSNINFEGAQRVVDANNEMYDKLQKNSQLINNLNNIAILNNPSVAKLASALQIGTVANIKGK